jgi:hypothetical protein
MRLAAGFLIFLLSMLSSVCSVNSEGVDGKAGGKDTFQKVNFKIDFTDYEAGSVESWLTGKGFQFERDARNRKKLVFEIGEEGLILDIKRSMFGMILNEGVDFKEFTSIKIEWGVFDYPEGTSYEDGIRNEALMVIVFFGYNKIYSGHFLIPNAPYFIGFFLAREEKVGKGYVGSYYQKSGRYVCLGNPKEGVTVISEYNLVEAFKEKYEKGEITLISGVALAMDTTKSKNSGKARAFIKSI